MELRGGLFPENIYTKVVPHYVDKLCNAGQSQEFDKGVCARYKADDPDLPAIPSLAKQRAFVCDLNNEPAGSVLEGMDDEKSNWDIGGMISAEEVALYGFLEKL